MAGIDMTVPNSVLKNIFSGNGLRGGSLVVLWSQALLKVRFPR